jgi:choline monooxygenase
LNIAQPQLKNLESQYYVDPAIHQQERQQIFKRQWQMLGPLSRLRAPGAYVAVDVAGWKLFALRGRIRRLLSGKGEDSAAASRLTFELP